MQYDNDFLIKMGYCKYRELPVLTIENIATLWIWLLCRELPRVQGSDQPESVNSVLMGVKISTAYSGFLLFLTC